MTATLVELKGFHELPTYLERVTTQFRKLQFAPFGELELLEMADLHTRYFADASDPNGQPWPPLAPATIQRKGHDTILVDTNRLRTSLTSMLQASSGDAIRDIAELADETDIIFGTAVEYSMFHDFNSGNRPARRHVGLNETYLDGACERLLRFATNELAATA